MEKPQLALLVNPRARGGRTVARLQSVLEARPAIAARARVLEVGSEDDMTGILHEIPAEAVPVSVGGDGSVNRLVRSLRELGMGGRPIAVLPMGTGNAFAHAAGVGTLRRAMDALESPVTQRFDVFATTHPLAPVALVSLSVGLESAVLKRAAERRHWGRILGAIQGAAEGVAQSCEGLSLTADDELIILPSSKFYNAGLYNHRYYAFGRVVLPDNDPADGCGELLIHEAAAAYWRTLMRGGPPRDGPAANGVARRSWSKVGVSCDLPFQVDGDAVPGADFEVMVERRALTVHTHP